MLHDVVRLGCSDIIIEDLGYINLVRVRACRGRAEAFGGSLPE